jgi:subtilisin family serine protease
MAPIIIEKTEVCCPKVTRAEATKIDTSNTANLPPGIILTGGAKLRGDGLTGKGVRVAVIDSGVDESHPGFGDSIKQQVWLRSGTPLSEDDHGTHVAGTIHMMAPDAEIYDYRVFGRKGLDVDEAIATSIYEAVFDGCDVINMSLGGRLPSSSIRTAVQFAYDRNVIIVAAAGNEGDNDPLTNERRWVISIF